MRANVKNSLNYIRKITDFVPDVALILGSGLGGFTKTMEEVVCSIPYNRIPGFPVSTVSGHAGKYVMGYIKGVPVICMEGRVHYYEGYTPEEVVLPVRVMRAPGSLVVLRDHVSLFVPNPLRGANDPSEGERFPDMTEVYDRSLRKIIEQNAERCGMPISEGVYCQLSGPSYETPYEIKILAQMGVDVVGMSTVMEAIAANHMGMRLCGLSLVTNMAAGINTERLSHNDVKMAAKDAEKRFAALITASIGDVKHYLETLET